jgi:predicted Zn-dependent peptidase
LTEAIAVADWEWYVDYLSRIQAVTRDDVSRAAAECFQEDAATVGWFVPKAGGSPA